MGFCKICACGKKVVFERRFSFPDQCPDCGRRLMDFQTYLENEVPENTEENNIDNSEDESVKNNIDSVLDEKKNTESIKESENICYALRLEDGNEISIPEEGGIIGRTEVGAETLAPYNSVSRKHLKVYVRRNIGVMIEDLSSYGTFVNGQRIERNSLIRVNPGAIITLCNVKTELIAKGE